MEFQNSEIGVATTPALEHVEPVDLKVMAKGNLLEPIEAAWLLWTRRRWLLWFTMAGLILSTIIAFLLPKWYTSTTRLMPPDYGSNSALALALPALSGGSGSGGGTGSSITGLASRLLGMNTSGQLYIGVLRSRSVQDNVIKQFDLMKVYHARYDFVARKRLAQLTAITSDPNTGILTLSVADKDPNRAAGMAQAYIAALNQVLSKVNTSSAHRERIFLQQRLASVKSQMEIASREFSQFASKNAAIDIPAQAKAMVAAAANLQAQLIVAQAQLRGLQQIYTNKNARVQALQAQVGELQEQINKFGGKDINPASGSTLSNSELYPSVRQLPLLGVKYLDLYRQNKIDEAVYELLTKEFELAKLQEARDLPTAEVLDPAVVPEKKSSPHRLYIMLGGMFLAALLGSAWIVGRAVWDRIDPQQPWKVLGREVYDTCSKHPVTARIGRAANLFQRNPNHDSTRDG